MKRQERHFRPNPGQGAQVIQRFRDVGVEIIPQTLCRLFDVAIRKNNDSTNALRNQNVEDSDSAFLEANPTVSPGTVIAL